jgi:glycosyltransferase involved in cell wall biosynthesis
MEPIFSIIIPTLNSESVIAAALKSVLGQTYSRFEIVVQDGGSTDNTVKIISSFDDPRIRIFQEHDSGIYDAMNKGLSKARGEWLMFLGSDDTLYSNTVLERISNYICGEEQILYGNVISSRFNGKYDGEFSKEKIRIKNICHQSIFYHRSVFEKIGIFNVRFRTHADWEHNLRWFFSPKIFKRYLDLTIANYSDGGYSSSVDDGFHRDERNFQYLLNGARQLSFREKMTVVKSQIVKGNVRLKAKFVFKLLINALRIFFHA